MSNIQKNLRDKIFVHQTLRGGYGNYFVEKSDLFIFCRAKVVNQDNEFYELELLYHPYLDEIKEIIISIPKKKFSTLSFNLKMGEEVIVAQSKVDITDFNKDYYTHFNFDNCFIVQKIEKEESFKNSTDYNLELTNGNSKIEMDTVKGIKITFEGQTITLTKEGVSLSSNKIFLNNEKGEQFATIEKNKITMGNTTLTSSDVVVGNISLKNHKHTAGNLAGQSPITGVTGAPL